MASVNLKGNGREFVAYIDRYKGPRGGHNPAGSASVSVFEIVTRWATTGSVMTLGPCLSRYETASKGATASARKTLAEIAATCIPA